MKTWITDALATLQTSLKPVPHELNELDWKSDISPQKERLTQHLIAFANYSSGGIMVFGIENATGNLIGLDREQIEGIVQQLSNLGRNTIEPPIQLDHAVVEVESIPLLFIKINESSEKPAHLRGKPIDHSFIRSGGSTRKASRQEIGSMMLNSRNPKWEEGYATPVLDADTVLQSLDYKTILRLLNRPEPESTSELLKWLDDEKLIKQQGSGYYITKFGVVAAATRWDLFEDLARKRLRVIRYQGLNKVKTIDEKISQKGFAIGFEGLISYLKRILPHSEIIEKALRREVTVYPEIALREIIANALIHQDFSITGMATMIEIYDNRIEFTNPGALLPSKKIDRLIGATPESRNEILASAFMRYNICEQRGTGYQKVFESAELYGLPPVAFEQGDNFFKVTLYAPRKFSDMSQSERIEACYQHAALKFISSSAMTNTSLRERLKMNEKQRTQVSNLIRDALDAGRIKRKDPNSTSSKFVEYFPYWA
jgi:predicted HTH transcriptional regulator